MLVLRINLPREKRGDDFDKLVERITNHIEEDLKLEGVKIFSDNSGVEITTKSEYKDVSTEDNDLISIEIMISKNMVINNTSINEAEGYQIIESELKQFIKS